eukprot:gnl/MRDRNA2_/MRDRNA2_60335_c0_seq3.p1 gnl/MRDRNA2_/MRDRNA2_60335_c0~~gnl/MRDRNA2_/MRDRNA2_60335_c0_seq3.p1  ORF type:complete len:485 (-),score=88.42 gnl/MRDRNA2_/MRDRNA2_60335_c0_seq3:330-1718(-)
MPGTIPGFVAGRGPTGQLPQSAANVTSDRGPGLPQGMGRAGTCWSSWSSTTVANSNAQGLMSFDAASMSVNPPEGWGTASLADPMVQQCLPSSTPVAQQHIEVSHSSRNVVNWGERRQSRQVANAAEEAVKLQAWKLDPAQNPAAAQEWAHKVSSVKVEILCHTHDTIHDIFKNGPHQGEKVENLIERLCKGETKPEDLPWLVVAVDADRVHWVVFGNRRLHALKEFRRISGNNALMMHCIVHDLKGKDCPPALPFKYMDAKSTRNEGQSAEYRHRDKGKGKGKCPVPQEVVQITEPFASTSSSDLGNRLDGLLNGSSSKAKGKGQKCKIPEIHKAGSFETVGFELGNRLDSLQSESSLQRPSERPTGECRSQQNGSAQVMKTKAKAKAKGSPNLTPKSLTSIQPSQIQGQQEPKATLKPKSKAKVTCPEPSPDMSTPTTMSQAAEASTSWSPSDSVWKLLK